MGVTIYYIENNNIIIKVTKFKLSCKNVVLNIIIDIYLIAGSRNNSECR